MTFAKFEELVKGKYPNARVFKHGSKINVGVCFEYAENSKFSKTYQYNGTYCEVLNQLGIKAIYKHEYDTLVYALENAKKRNGTKNIFVGGTIDCSGEIEEYTNRLNEVNANYVIV